MADLHSIKGSAAAQARANLLELGGLAEDDSLRAPTIIDALDGLINLIDGHDTLNIRGCVLASNLKIIRDDVHRVFLRAELDAARRR